MDAHHLKALLSIGLGILFVIRLDILFANYSVVQCYSNFKLSKWICAWRCGL